jgi:proteasome lid subunit RPN8/RPN11
MTMTTPTTSRALRELLEPFVLRSSSTATGELRVDRIDLAGAALRGWPIEDGRYEQRSNGDIIEIRPMLQVTRAFVADYCGERVQIDTHSRVAVGHDIARAHPGWFEPVNDLAAPGARSRRATPTRAPAQATRPKPRPVTIKPPAPPEYTVQLRETQSRAKVSISEFAYEVIERECMRMACFDDIETGGFLAGTVAQSWHKNISICDARGPGARSEHKHSAMRIDLSGDAQLERDFAWSDAGIGESGIWHSHPNGDATPSPTDLDTWADALRYVSDRRGSSLYLGIIATPRRQRGHWNFPHLTAYVIRRDERDGYICEPAAVTIRGMP